jgi:hypothetical protein
MIVALGVSIVISACSAPRIQSRAVHELIPSTLKVRRPVSPGADPLVGPGGIDYRSAVLPNERLDCESVSELFSGMDLPAVRSCLASIRRGEIRYDLDRATQPAWVLHDPEDAPECVARLLARIPVPREIFFQSWNEGNANCYASRIDLESDELLHVKVPFRGQKSLQLEFPLMETLGSDADLVRVLGSWALTPIWKEDGSFLDSKIVPDSICRKCLGENAMFHPGTGVEPELWPPEKER